MVFPTLLNNGSTFLGVLYFLVTFSFGALLFILVIKTIQALDVYIKKNR